MINIFVTLWANFRNSQIFRINKSELDLIFSRKSSLSKITFGCGFWCFCPDVCEGRSAIVCRLLQLQACNVGADNWASHAVRRLLSTLGGYFQGIRINISLLLIAVIITIYFIILSIRPVLELWNGEVQGLSKVFFSWIYILTKIVGLEGWGRGSTPNPSSIRTLYPTETFYKTQPPFHRLGLVDFIKTSSHWWNFLL